MRTILYDVNLNNINYKKDDILIDANKCLNHCTGCFSCWTTPSKKCIINDKYNDISSSIGLSKELIIISKSYFGCYSSNIKRVLERCISYVLPYFTLRKKEIHHKSRFKNKLKLSAYFYGDINDEEKQLLNELIKRNALNLNTENYEVKYFNLKENKCIL